MHEMSIAEILVKQIVEAARANGLPRVTEAEVEVGVMRQVVPEAMELAFAALSEETLAAGAKLVIREIPLEGRCRVCGRSYAMPPGWLSCPDCGAADVEITAGNDIVLKSISLDEEAS